MAVQRVVNRPLTHLQLRFVHRYLETGNGLRSAQEAGYSKHTAAATGSRLLTQSNVQAELARLREQQAELAVYTAEGTVQAIGELAHSKLETSSIRLQALSLLAKVQGLLVERSVTASMDMDAGSLSATLELVAGLSPAGLPAAPPAPKSLQASSLDDG